MARKKKRPARRSRQQQNAIVRFYRETVGELRKVTWPTRREALNLTGLVLIVITAMTLFFWLFDFLFSQVFGLILGS
ncbi:MAG: preprotein translocase subunit SecE [Anaerolineales bacterium]